MATIRPQGNAQAAPAGKKQSSVRSEDTAADAARGLGPGLWGLGLWGLGLWGLGLGLRPRSPVASAVVGCECSQVCTLCNIIAAVAGA